MPDKLIVIGGSAGAHRPLREIVGSLSSDLAAPVLVTVHLAPGAESRLPRMLDAAGPLEARQARHGDRLEPGSILVAPSDRHLVVHEDMVYLSRGPRENRHRPAVDPLFITAARWHGHRVIGVVLSGALDDGAAGAAAIAAQDGVVIVQDPQEATISTMPHAAARAVRRARVIPSGGIASMLTELTAQPPSPSSVPEVDPVTKWETENVDPTRVQPPTEAVGDPSAISCPECNGGMFEASLADAPLRYICHVGHSWSPESLMDAQREVSEESLYGAAAKMLEEATVLRRVAQYQHDLSQPEAAALEARAAEAENLAEQIQALLLGD